jgi:hypothetical protein
MTSPMTSATAMIAAMAVRTMSIRARELPEGTAPR